MLVYEIVKEPTSTRQPTFPTKLIPQIPNSAADKLLHILECKALDWLQITEQLVHGGEIERSAQCGRKGELKKRRSQGYGK